MTLREYLKKARLTETEFAMKIGKNQTTVGRYKRFELIPDVATILRIEQATNGKVKFKDWVQ